MKNYLNKNWPLLILPLVMIPFIVLIFYILGGGTAPESGKKEIQQFKGKVGINYTLPQADRTIGIVDKMEAVQSQIDRTNTRDYHIEGGDGSMQIGFGSINDSLSGQSTEDEMQDKQGAVLKSGDAAIPDHLMEHIRKQEALVKREMADAVGDTVRKQNEAVNTADPSGSEDLKGKYPEYRALSAPAKRKTSGIEELDELFDRNEKLTRQNDSLNARLQEAVLKDQQTATEIEAKHFTLEKGKSIENSKKTEEPIAEAIPAEIYETATVMSGNRVKIRLLESARLSGLEIPRNTFVYGICRTDNERLQIDVLQIQSGGQFLPVKITVCDLDGMPGLYVPDQAARKVTREVGGSVNTSSMAGFTTNPLAYAGVQAADRAARTVLQVIKQKKVTIKKNTLVYLINKTK